MEEKINTYIKEVAAYFLFKKRTDVENTVKKIITSEVGTYPADDDMEIFLRKHGAPVELASQFSNKRYIFSNTIIYLEFFRVIKVLLPITACIAFVIGFLISTFSSSIYFPMIILRGSLFAIGISLLALLSTTLGFYLLDKSGKYFNTDGKIDWEFYDL